MAKSLLFLLFFILISLSASFVSPSTASDHRHLLLKSVSASSTDTTTTTRNIFFDYDKPIVLIGTSSAGNEMQRLAKSILQTHFPSSSSTTKSNGDYYETVTNSIGGIVQVASKDGSLLSTDKLLEYIQDKTYQWPDVVVIDFNDDLFLADNEQHYIEMGRSLYENGLLSIYVNVNSDNSNMEESVRVRKEKLEENVLVRWSDYELCIRDEGIDETNAGWENIEWELSRILARARLIPAIPGDKARSQNTAHLTMGKHTFFLSLTFPEIQMAEPYIPEMCFDVDAMEYRTDLLRCRNSRFDLIYGMQLLRRYCRPHAVRVPALSFSGTVLEDVMPIVYTVRTQNQAGTYPDDKKGIDNMFEVLEWGLRGGVEVLDVESAWDKEKTKHLLDQAEERYSTQILGSHHVVGKEISTEDAVLLFEQCALDGRAHGAKVVLSIDSEERDRMAYEAALIASELARQEERPVIPNISLILGQMGQFSRVINLCFTPVTHESLPFPAAPGQMTSNEIMTTRILTQIFERKKYCILGHNIAYSVSPQMQGAAFAATKLPHQYLRVDVENVQEFVDADFFQSRDFGGASVTIPHKQAIIPYLDVLSESARAIGSVNTIVAKEEFVDEGFRRVLYGENTDWRGIFNPLNRLLEGSIDVNDDYALILGAGGKVIVVGTPTRIPM